MPYYQYAGMADGDVARPGRLSAHAAAGAAREPRGRGAPAVPAPRVSRLAAAVRAARHGAGGGADAIRSSAAATGRPRGDLHATATRRATASARSTSSLYLAGTDDGPGRQAGAEHHAGRRDRHRQVDGGADRPAAASGMLPDMDNVQGMMAEVIDGYGGGPGYAKAPEAELRSIAKYMKSGAAGPARGRRLATDGGRADLPGGDLDSERVKGGSDARHGEVVGDPGYRNDGGVPAGASGRRRRHDHEQAAAGPDPRPPRADGGERRAGGEHQRRLQRRLRRLRHLDHPARGAGDRAERATRSPTSSRRAAPIRTRAPCRRSGRSGTSS